MATSARLVIALARAARDLDKHATITHPIGGHPVPVCMTPGLRDYTVRDPQVRAALPPVGGTVAEYAASVRDLAATI
jgi:hypothetical protein